MSRLTCLLVLIAVAQALPCNAHADDRANALEFSRPARAWLDQADYLRAWLNREGFELGARVHLRAYKESRELEVHLLREGRFHLFRTFRICAISGILGPKLSEGDLQAPEGFYRVTPERMHPRSEFHLAFNLGFPNERDRALGRTGSNIMIHGGCASNGCFAITDYYMEQLWVLTEAAFEHGQDAIDVHVFPFRMTPENLVRYHDAEHIEFWRSLEPAERFFNENGFPPLIDIHGPDYRLVDIEASGAADGARSAP